jgi:hypothetical protein
MIRCFPDPYPDELFYSICARFGERMRYSAEYTVVLELFRNKRVKPVVDLPSHLDKLVRNLPQENGYTSDYFIDNHTLLPYYGAFLSPYRLEELRNNMRGDDGPSVHMRAGVVGSLVPLPALLRFCPLCVDEDRKKRGECYWHRVHQAPGVEVCATHKVFLQNSQAHVRNIKPFGHFVSAESAVWPAQVRQLDLANQHHQILLNIANDTAWLLNRGSASYDPQLLREQYKALLFERGLTGYRGIVNVDMLTQAFNAYYSIELLSLLSCRLNDFRDSSWLARITQKSPHVQHPLHHILLIHFLGCTVRDFFSLSPPAKPHPFGEGPWPCLNRVCTHYKQPHIKECNIIYPKNKGGRPAGLFSCSCCGFVYYRTGPDSSIDDRFRYTKVESFGPFWETEMQKLWECSTISIRAIARQLGVCPNTIKICIARLGLSLTRGRNKHIKAVVPCHSRASRISKSERAKIYKAEWLTALEANPGASLKILQSKREKVYSWLSRHESEWLEIHKPKPGKAIKRQRSHVNWGERDVQYLKAVQDSVSRLKNSPGYPIRLTISAISRDTGLLPSMEDHLDKLPLTAQFLNELIETDEMFAIRRVWWATICYRQEQVCPTKRQLMKRAGVVSAQVKWPKVKEAIGSAMLTLDPSNTNH